MNKLILLLIMPAISFLAHSKPQDFVEFVNANRSSYSTMGDEKAKGLNVSFEYPASWRGEPGIRSNTLHKITSRHGKGLEACTIAIKDIPLPKGYVLSKKEVESLFLPDELPNFIPLGAKLISSQQTKIDGQPSGMVEYSQEFNRAGLTTRMTSLSFFIYFDNKLINFGCVAAGSLEELPSKHMSRFEEYKQLFQLMAASIVIHTKWK
jgi:hypothetical protein